MVSFFDENNRAKIIKDLYQLGGLPCEPNQLSVLVNIDTIFLFVLLIIIIIAILIITASNIYRIIRLVLPFIIILALNLTNVKICS